MKANQHKVDFAALQMCENFFIEKTSYSTINLNVDNEALKIYVFCFAILKPDLKGTENGKHVTVKKSEIAVSRGQTLRDESGSEKDGGVSRSPQCHLH